VAIQKRTRTLPITNLRSEKTDGGHTISGYASLYGVLSEYIRPGVKERIAIGAFDEAVAKSEVTANVNHDDAFLLGRTSSGTLRLKADELGLAFEVDVPDTTTGRDIGVLMSRGDLRDVSFAFTVDPEDIQIERASETESVDVIKRVAELFDVSVVVRGAYRQPFSVFRSEELAQTSVVGTNPDDAAEAHKRDAVDSQAEAEGHPSDASIALEIARLDLAVQAIEE
jgi:HK97 family phage prohead protease